MSEIIPIPDKFFKPFYKLHLASLLESERVSGGWSVRAEGTEERLVCCMVWLQAEVAEINLEEGWVELEEEGSRVNFLGEGGSGQAEGEDSVHVVRTSSSLTLVLDRRHKTR